MPDQLNLAPEPTPEPAQKPGGAHRPARRSVVLALATVLVGLVAGPLLGWLWETIWTPTQGLVVQHQWYVVDSDLTYDLDGLRHQFSGTMLYTVLAVPAGLVLGAVAALLSRRDEVLTLLAVVVGSAALGLGMWATGTWLGPQDPQVLAATATQGTSLPDHLSVGSWSVLVCAPLAATLAVTVVFGLLPRLHVPTRRPG
ncbi:hypothetical protein [Nocardioides sp. GY 10127]|uniref:hypothetical protein n=1 Tax=Nocardioides sp. GY 10127 TaxID=2569762 RepID=UPI0010A7B1B6|nr:hypothetical protein [Nocardioides sp. GY 10127]TIC80991.1 hypothetical protein E8D37_14305 [Nocardioides sp. GY 10127]